MYKARAFNKKTIEILPPFFFTEEVGERANTLEVNIEDAIREKEEINKKRTWK